MKKILILTLSLMLVLCSSVCVFAGGIASNPGCYTEAQYYYQLPDGSRLVSESYNTFGSKPLYIINESDGFRIACQDGQLYRVWSDDTYDTLGYGVSDFSYESNGTTFRATRKFTYPADFFGTTISNFSQLENLKGASGTGVFRLYESTNYNEGTDFFKNPLLETVKEQQKGTTKVASQTASYLHFLVPFGIGLMVLLISLPLFGKVLRRYL